MNVRTRIDFRLFRRSELLWARERRSSDETRLSFFGAAFRFRVEDFSDAVINYFNNRRAAAWIRLQHDIRWLDVAVHHAARFRGAQCARRLFDYFERDCERHWTFATDLSFERFAFDQFHDIETLTVLLAVMTHARDIRMTDLRGRARFAQETRSDSRHLRDFSVYDFKSDDGIQNRVACTISNRDCSRAELNRKTVGADFNFEVIVLQWSRRQSPGCFRLPWFLTAAQKTQIGETTKAFAFWTYLRERSSTDRACSDGWFGFHTGKCERSI